MRVPKQFAQASDAQIIVRLQTGVTGKVQGVQKLNDLPQAAAGSVPAR